MKFLPGGPKTITRTVYYQLMGLFVHHARLEAMRHEVEKTVAELVDEKSDDGYYFGHVSDCLFNKKTVNEMLEKLDIEIKVEDDDAQV